MGEADLAHLLASMTAGDQAAASEFFSLVYDKLRSLAHRELRGRSGSLATTGLVDEVYLKLFHGGARQWASQAQFLGTAARAMRQVLVDHARRRRAQKRLPTGQRVPLDELVDDYEARGADVLEIDDALHRLRRVDAQLVTIVEMRYFAGYSIADTARLLGLSTSKVHRSWQVARAWLVRELHDRDPT